MTGQLTTTGISRASLDADGQPLAVLQAGSPSGPPVLLVPGYTGGKEDFAPILAPLAAAGLWVTAIDLPGQYQSPPRPHVADYQPDALAPIVAAAARRLGSAVHLLGHSFGGFVTRSAVLADARPFGSHVLMDSGAAAIQGARRAVIDYLEPMLADHDLDEIYELSLQQRAQRPGFQAPSRALADFLRRRFVAGDPTMLLGMGMAVRSEPDRVAALARVDLPTLVLYGVDDDAWPAAEQTDLARRLACESIAISGAAHSPAVENPAATAAALIDFWRRLD